MRCFPVHRHANASASTWVIEKNEFFQRCRVELAVSAELQCYFGHSVWFSRGVDAKSVGFALGDAHGAINYRREQKTINRKNQDQERETSGVRDAAHAPFLAPATNCAIKN